MRYRLGVADLDEPRFLGAKLGYTHLPHRSIDPSAECVSEVEQRRQTMAAHRREHERLHDAWRPVIVALDDFLSLTLPRPIAHRAASVARLARSVDRELGV